MINEVRWPNTSLNLSKPTLAVVATATPASEVEGPNSATITNAGITQAARILGRRIDPNRVGTRLGQSDRHDHRLRQRLRHLLLFSAKREI